MRVTVVDSFSEDGSVELLRDLIVKKSWGGWVSLVTLDQNEGFAGGNNRGIAHAAQWTRPPRYTLLLNPDTKVRQGAVSCLSRFLDEHPDAGIVGSRLEWESGEGQHAGRRFPGILSEFEGSLRFGPISRLLSNYAVAPPDPEKATPVDWVVGAAMMIRQEVLEQVGLLDEEYFLYFEEVDFCFQARRAGWQTWYIPGSRVIHYVGASSGVTSTEKHGRCPSYWFESRRRYFLKNYGRATLWAANLAALVGLSLHSARGWFRRTPGNDHEGFLADFVRFNFFHSRAVSNQ
jgi:GT2 family glycosyltransferase